MSRWDALVELQLEAIAEARAAGEDMFLGLPDAWYESATWGCENAHTMRMYIKSSLKGAMCPACQKPIVLLPPGYTDDTLGEALGAYL